MKIRALITISQVILLIWEGIRHITTDLGDTWRDHLDQGKLGTNLFVYITMVLSFVWSFVLNSCSKSSVISITQIIVIPSLLVQSFDQYHLSAILREHL